MAYTVFEVKMSMNMKCIIKRLLQHMGSYLKYESQVNLKNVCSTRKFKRQNMGGCKNNLGGEYQNTNVKKKYAMRSGETDCAETIYSPRAKALGKAITESFLM
jgi:carbamoyl-phosphate synthase large subunit